MALEVFITPKARETIFSMLTRAHILSGSSSPLTSLRDLTGHRGYKPLTSLPSNINHICGSLHLSERPEKIITGHTLFPLYRPFLPQSRRNFVTDGMLNCGAVKSRIGLLKSHCGAADQLAYCCECVKDDVYNYGFPYWHREHMLVGVEVCHLHRLPLTKVELDENKFGTRCFQLPGEQSAPNIWSELQYKQLCFIAEQVAIITNTEIEVFIGSHSYHQALSENLFLTDASHVRMKSLHLLVEDWLLPLAKVRPFDELLAALNVERNWVANIVAGKEGMHHPIKHIILWGALNIDFHNLTRSVQRVEQLVLPLIFYQRPEITKEVLQAAVTQCGSASASARLLNCSTQTVLVLMEKFGLTTKRKPKKLNQIIIEKVINLSLRGVSTAKIAAELGLSISTVNRIERSHV